MPLPHTGKKNFNTFVDGMTGNSLDIFRGYRFSIPSSFNPLLHPAALAGHAFQRVPSISKIIESFIAYMFYLPAGIPGGESNYRAALSAR